MSRIFDATPRLQRNLGVTRRNQADPRWGWFWDSVAWATAPGGVHRLDILGQHGTLTPYGSVWNHPTAHGPTLSGRATSGPAEGAHWPQPDDLQARVNQKLTMVVFTNTPVSGAKSNWAPLLCISYRNDGTNATPFFALCFQRNAQTTQHRFSFGGAAGAYRTTDSTAGSYVANTKNELYAVTRNGATVSFYRNGKLASTHTGRSADNVNYNGQQNVMQVGHSNAYNYATNGGDRYDGDIMYAAVFDRVLLARELAQLAHDPWGPFRRRRSLVAPVEQIIRPVTTISAGSWTAVGAATLHEAIDETIINDSDYISYTPTGPTPDTAKFGLTNLSTGVGPGDVTIVARTEATEL